MKYISLHGYIRNTPSDTEVHAEQIGQEYLTSRKEYISSVQFSRSVVSDSLQPMNRSTPGLPVLMT